MKSKKPAQVSLRGFTNRAPLTGHVFASNGLLITLSLNDLSVRTALMTTNRCGFHKSGGTVG